MLESIGLDRVPKEVPDLSSYLRMKAIDAEAAE